MPATTSKSLAPGKLEGQKLRQIIAARLCVRVRGICFTNTQSLFRNAFARSDRRREKSNERCRLSIGVERNVQEVPADYFPVGKGPPNREILSLNILDLRMIRIVSSGRTPKRFAGHPALCT